MAAAVDISSLEKDPRLFLYTSLTAGSSHIITATSRMETILKANKIPFQAIDTATDEKARKLWQRRAGGKKLPGLVKEGYVIGDLEEVEEWNEFGELKDNIGPVPANNAAPAGGQVGVNIAPPILMNPSTAQEAVGIPRALDNKAPKPLFDKSKAIPLPGAEEIAARNKAASAASAEAAKPETMTSSPNDKKASIEEAKEVAKSHPSIDHLSAPASRIQSGSATPAQEEESSPKSTKHRGSDVVEAPLEEIKKIEQENSLQEVEEPEEEGKEVTSGVAGLKVGEEEVTPQKQEVEEPEEEGKEVTSGVAGLKVDEEEVTPQKQDPKDATEAGTSNED